MAVINGTNSNNTLTGTASSDTIFGLGGIDTLLGLAGNDVLVGGPGNDRLDGGSGVDTASYAGSPAVRVSLAIAGAQDTGGAGTDRLISIENLIGGSGDDDLTGNAGANRLAGDKGDDTLIGGAGNDLLVGGTGNDTASYAGTATTVRANLTTGTASGGAGTDTLVGIESLTGGDGDDTLTGNAGANWLKGGVGADSLIGGAGNDTYTFTVGDTIIENPGEGTDTIRSTIGVDISAMGLNLPNVENVTLTGAGNVNVTGNNAGNVIIGNSGNNNLSGNSDPDNEDNDKISGGAGDDVLNGGAGNDTLNGGSGVDVLTGGNGDDLFIVDNPGDIVIEAMGGVAGLNDTIQSSVSFVMPANFEHLMLTGTADLYGVGSGTLTGNAGDNLLLASDFIDVVNGGAGDDTLDGGGGDDTLFGGAGNDVYVVDSTTDIVDEDVGDNGNDGGIDVVFSFASFTLPNPATFGRFEQLELAGAANINGTGTAFAETITGNAGDNSLSGLGGDDRLFGRDGNDILVGGAGNDILRGGFDVGFSGDTLVGGFGRDNLDGGFGFDFYLYVEFGDVDQVLTNTVRGGAVTGDIINGFVSGIDRLHFDPTFDVDNDGVGGGDLVPGQLTLGVDFSIIAAQYNGLNPGTNTNFAADRATFVFSTADDTLYFDANAADAGYFVVGVVNGGVLAATDIEIVA